MKYLTIIFLIFTLSTFGQKILRDEIGDFTGNRIIETYWYTLSAKSYSYIRLIKHGDNTFYEIKIPKNVGMREGNNVLIKFNDDSIIELPNSSAAPSKGDGAVGLFFSDAMGVRFEGLLSDKNLLLLQTKTVKEFRIHTSEGYIGTDLKEKKSNGIKELALLIPVSEEQEFLKEERTNIVDVEFNFRG